MRIELNASDWIDGKQLVGRWFTHQGRDCVVRAVGEVQEMPGRAGHEVGVWQLEMDGKVLEWVYSTLEAATRRLVEHCTGDPLSGQRYRDNPGSDGKGS